MSIYKEKWRTAMRCLDCDAESNVLYAGVRYFSGCCSNCGSKTASEEIGRSVIKKRFIRPDVVIGIEWRESN